MNELSLFSGAGGGLLGTKLLGWQSVGYVERDPYCQAVLQARIADGLLDPAPIFGDIRQFLSGGWAERYRGLVDVVTAGFPCQPFSVAGKRRAHEDDRNLWPETARVLGVVRPRYALLENVPGLVAHRYFGTVLGDLAALGFDAEWCVLGADDVGAPHRRKRLWLLAHAHGTGDEAVGRTESRGCGESRKPELRRDVADSLGQRLEERPGEAGLRELEAAVGGGALPDAECDQLRDEPGGRSGARWAGAIPSRDDGADGRLADASLDGRESRRASDEAEVARGRQPDRGGIEPDGLADASRDGGAEQAEGWTERERTRPSGEWWGSDPANEGPESESGLGGMVDGLARGLDEQRPAVARLVPRVASGVRNRVDRLRALGNGQVPGCVVRAWHELYGRIEVNS